MKYLFVGGFELPDKNAAAQRVMAIADMLVQHGHFVDLIGLSKNPNSEKKFASYAQGLRILNDKYPRTKFEWLSYLTSIHRIKDIIKTSDYDVVLCYNFPAIAFIHLSLNRNVYKFKLIADLTEWYSSDSSDPIFNLIKYVDVTLRMYTTPFLADRIIVASKYLEDFYKRSKTLVVPTLVPKNCSIPHVEKMHADNECLHFVYAGFPFYKIDESTAVLKDRIDQVVDAFINQKAGNWHLNIFGITEADYCRYLKKDRHIFFGKCVIFHGKVDRLTVLKQYVKSDYSIFFRDYTRSNVAGFPTKLSESFELKVPVITNEIGDSSSYIKNNCGVVFPYLADDYHFHLERVIKLGIQHSEILKDNLRNDNPLDQNKWVDKVCLFMTFED